MNFFTNPRADKGCQARTATQDTCPPVCLMTPCMGLSARCADPEPVMAQANVSAKVLFQQVEAAHTYATSGLQTGLNVTIQDTADVLSRLEVSHRHYAPRGLRSPGFPQSLHVWQLQTRPIHSGSHAACTRRLQCTTDTAAIA